MALTLPFYVVPGRTPLPSLHASPRCSTPLPSASHSLTSWRARASRVRCVPLGHDIGLNSGAVSVYNVKSEESSSCSGSGRRSVEEPVVLRVSAVSALAVAASLTRGGVAVADEVVAAASPVDGSDVGISTTVSVLFVAATVGLVVLTGGVIYLGLTEFLEKRALQEEQKRVEAAKPKEKPSKQAAKAAARSGGPKGFGSSKRTGMKGDNEEVN